MSDVPFNPALNLRAYSVQSAAPVPPALNAVYLRDGVFDGMTRDDIRASFTAYRLAPARTPLALFFHGGLVSKEWGSQAAANEYEAYKADVFPLFFIWQSGIWEVLGHHLPLIFAETIFGRIKAHTEALASQKFGLPSAQGGLGTAPGPAFTIMGSEVDVPDTVRAGLDISVSDMEAYTAAIAGDPAIQNEVQRIALAPYGPAAGGTTTMAQQVPSMLRESVIAAIKAAYEEPVSARTSSQSIVAAGVLQAAITLSKLALPVLVNTIKRYMKRRDHGLTCTVVEEILRTLYGANAGSSIWEEMKRETEDAFGSDPERYGGTAVILELVKLISERPDLRVTLVGHSTGGVYIGNFLRHVDAALDKVDFTFSVVLLAPANTFDFFAQNYGQRVRAIRLFGMNDDAEKTDLLMSSDVATSGNVEMLGRVYPRSLLYLVSGICETFEAPGTTTPHDLDAADMPILGMDRFFADQAVFQKPEYQSVANARALLGNPPRFTRVLSPTPDAAPVGFRSRSLKHGNFPGDAETIDSLRHCFANGIS